MKILLAILISLTLAKESDAGLLGLFTSKVRNWQFIQSSGGIRVSAPIEKNDKEVLPVDYWPEGNSGLVVRKIELKQRDTQLVIRVVTQVAEKGSDTAHIHYVDLSSVPPGPHEVYYESAGDTAKLIGRIEVK